MPKRRSKARPPSVLVVDSINGAKRSLIDDPNPFYFRLRFLGCAIVILVCAATMGQIGSSDTRSAEASTNVDQILVKFKANASNQAIAALNASLATNEIDRIPALGVRILRVPNGQAASQAVTAYKQNPLVQFAEPNLYAKALDTTPNDPWYLNWQWAIKKIQGPAAWDTTTGSQLVTIAVIDTGVDATHPDLVLKVLPGYNFVANNLLTFDDHGHGTGVAGVAAASSNNGLGMAGVSWKSVVLPVKVCDSAGSCAYSNVAKGIIFAADNGAKVINLSIGGVSACGSTFQSAVDYAWNKGAVVVAAAGNEGGAVNAPANCNNVVAVGATDSTDVRTTFSNYGTTLDLVAPGVGVTCTSVGGGIGQCSGTSFSSPLTAGVAALLMAQGATNGATVGALAKGADDIGTSGWDQYYGAGRLNAVRAIQALTGSSSPATPTPTQPVATATPIATATRTAVPSPTPSPVSASKDTSPPVVILTNPKQGEAIKNQTSLSASVSDNVAAVKVEFYVDDVLYKTVTAQPFSTPLNTRKWSNGSHSIVAKAYDAAGNSASDTRSVLITN